MGKASKKQIKEAFLVCSRNNHGLGKDVSKNIVYKDNKWMHKSLSIIIAPSGKI
jgi:hypothetical protein